MSTNRGRRKSTSNGPIFRREVGTRNGRVLACRALRLCPSPPRRSVIGLWPIEMFPQKLKRPAAIDCVRAVEEFDFGAIASAQLVVKPPDFRVLPGDPL